MISKVSNKKTVFFKYSVTDTDDNVLEQSDIPVGYVHGVANNMFPELERALKNKQVNDKISVTLQPPQHFGDHNASLTFTDDVVNVPDEFCKVDAEAEFQNANNETVKMKVVKINNGKIFLDGNHPFAGKIITYNITITAISDATTTEIATGHPTQNHPYL